MNLFSPEQVDQLRAEFPDCDIPGAIAKIEKRARDGESIRHPMSLARGYLKREADEAPAPIARTTPGTFRPDGSWWAEAAHASATERAVREFHNLMLRTLVSPADAVAMIRQSPELLACYRETNLAIMAKLTASPQPCPGGPYGEMAWADAAWSGVPCSTSAERVIKTGLIARWRKRLIAEYNPALAAADAASQAVYDADEYPDAGSPW